LWPCTQVFIFQSWLFSNPFSHASHHLVQSGLVKQSAPIIEPRSISQLGWWIHITISWYIVIVIYCNQSTKIYFLTGWPKPNLLAEWWMGEAQQSLLYLCQISSNIFDFNICRYLNLTHWYLCQMVVDIWLKYLIIFHIFSFASLKTCCNEKN